MRRNELARSVYQVTPSPLNVLRPGVPRELKPAARSIWYVLATVAGEPEKAPDPVRTQQQNREYWNAIMGERAGAFALGPVGSKSTVVFGEMSSERRFEIFRVLRSRGFGEAQIPGPDDPIDFSYLHFTDPVWFDGFVFIGPASFEGAQFEGHSHSFQDAVFNTDVTFDDARFSGVFFGEKMTFAGYSSFKRATFCFGASFGNSEFLKGTSFDEAEFSEDANFNHCTFHGFAAFAGVLFKQLAEFGSATFQTSALFQRANFKSFVPLFFEANLPEYTVWHDVSWPKTPRDPVEALDHIQRYQRLALLMNGVEKFNDQRFFIRQEMRVQRRVEKWFPVGLMNLGYEAICGYGHGLTRVVMMWLVHMVLGAGVLCAAKIPKLTAEKTLWQATRESFSDFHLAFALSFGNAHGPLGLNRTFFAEVLKDWPWYQVVGPVQTVLGVIILFFLLLTIRNRFRMR